MSSVDIHVVGAGGHQRRARRRRPAARAARRAAGRAAPRDIDARRPHVAAAARAWPRRGAICCCRPSTPCRTAIGWVSRGALNYICLRLIVPPAEAWGVVTFYHLFATEPRAADRGARLRRHRLPRARGRGAVRAAGRRLGPQGEAPARPADLASQPVPGAMRTGAGGADVGGRRARPREVARVATPTADGVAAPRRRRRRAGRWPTAVARATGRRARR